MSTTSSSRKRPTSSRKTPNRKSNIKSRSNVLQILKSSSDDDDNYNYKRWMMMMQAMDQRSIGEAMDGASGGSGSYRKCD